MTLADSGKETITVHGPPPLAYSIATARHFTKRAGTRLDVKEPHDPLQGSSLLPSAPLQAVKRPGLTIRSILTHPQACRPEGRELFRKI